MDIRTVLVFLKEWRCFCWEKVGKSYLKNWKTWENPIKKLGKTCKIP
jgi:hypothetical protein